MTADPISADDAFNIGMIYKVYDDNDFENEVLKLAEKLSQMPTKGLGLTKKLLNLSLTNDLENQLNEELNAQIIAGNTNDFNEGVNAFLEKRNQILKEIR